MGAGLSAASDATACSEAGAASSFVPASKPNRCLNVPSSSASIAVTETRHALNQSSSTSTLSQTRRSLGESLRWNQRHAHPVPRCLVVLVLVVSASSPRRTGSVKGGRRPSAQQTRSALRGFREIPILVAGGPGSALVPGPRRCQCLSLARCGLSLRWCSSPWCSSTPAVRCPRSGSLGFACVRRWAGAGSWWRDRVRTDSGSGSRAAGRRVRAGQAAGQSKGTPLKRPDVRRASPDHQHRSWQQPKPSRCRNSHRCATGRLGNGGSGLRPLVVDATQWRGVWVRAAAGVL